MHLGFALLWYGHAYLLATVARQLGYAIVVCLPSFTLFSYQTAVQH